MLGDKYYASDFTVYNDNKFHQGKIQKVNYKMIFVNRFIEEIR